MDSNRLQILGIETSCDETSIALIEVVNTNRITIKKHFIHSQIEDHKAMGGVVPEKAARLHLQILPKMIRNAKMDFSKIGYIAVTAGPGLATSLMVGMDIAKTLAWRHSIPLIPVNHVYGHLLAAELPDAKKGGSRKKLPLPTLGLIVSGGHSELVIINKKWEATIVGRTRDDAAGEAFDKAARLIGLPYPGGPEIEHLSKEGDDLAYQLPRPMEKQLDTNDYSFSGLKNALRLITLDKKFSKKQKADLAGSFQKAVVDSLIIKFEKAILEYKPKSIILGGGVANNTLLRNEVKALAKRNGLDALLTPRQYTGDNAAMIAWAGFHSRKKSLNVKQFGKLRVDPQLSYEK